MTDKAQATQEAYNAAFELWMGAVGAIPYGRLAKALRELILRYGWPRVEAALREYITNARRPLRIEFFAQDFHQWDREAREPLADGLDLTPKGQRIWNELNRGAGR